LAKRAFLGVQEFPLVGGRLCLDFVNTTGNRSRSPRERLMNYDDVLLWSRRQELLMGSNERSLGSQARRYPALSRRFVDRLKRFRESLYRVLRCLLDHTEPDARDSRLVAQVAETARRKQRLEFVLSTGRWELKYPLSHIEDVLWPIADSAMHLLTSSEVSRVKKCGECDWLFLDETKNQARRWCKKVCGDRVKSRRYYRRRVARQPAAPRF
jgi:predicted RNA-binding Zn ribbon-like protein